LKFGTSSNILKELGKIAEELKTSVRKGRAEGEPNCLISNIEIMKYDYGDRRLSLGLDDERDLGFKMKFDAGQFLKKQEVVINRILVGYQKSKLNRKFNISKKKKRNLKKR
jgi:hypothetical protein